MRRIRLKRTLLTIFIIVLWLDLTHCADDENKGDNSNDGKDGGEKTNHPEKGSGNWKQ